MVIVFKRGYIAKFLSLYEYKYFEILLIGISDRLCKMYAELNKLFIMPTMFSLNKTNFLFIILVKVCIKWFNPSLYTYSGIFNKNRTDITKTSYNINLYGV